MDTEHLIPPTPAQRAQAKLFGLEIGPGTECGQAVTGEWYKTLTLGGLAPCVGQHQPPDWEHPWRTGRAAAALEAYARVFAAYVALRKRQCPGPGPCTIYWRQTPRVEAVELKGWSVTSRLLISDSPDCLIRAPTLQTVLADALSVPTAHGPASAPGDMPVVAHAFGGGRSGKIGAY